MICLDTNIVIELFKGKPDIISELRRYDSSALCISSVVMAEIYQGAFNATELRSLERGLLQFRQLPILPEIGENMLALMKQYILSHRLTFPDALIAATALHHGLPLFTLNRKDFRYITGLQLHEPV